MDALQLRFTAGETSLAPPDLAAFRGVDPVLLREQLAEHDDVSPLGDLLTAMVVATRLRLLVEHQVTGAAPTFVTLRGAPIPAIEVEVEAEAEPVDPQDFALADHIRGHFVWPAAPARRSSRGAALVLAACIPLVVPDVALAVPLPGPPMSEPASPPAPQPGPEPVVTSEPAPAPAPTPPPAMANLQVILDAMKGRDAIVFAGGARVVGTIIGVEGDFVMLVDKEREGRIAMIPRAQITEVRARMKPKPQPELPSGNGMLVGGGLLTGVGAVLMVSGLAFVGLSPSYTSGYLPQIFPALGMLGAGIPLLVVGSRRRTAFRAAASRSTASRGGRLRPAVGRTPGGGWTGGLRFAF